MGERRVVLGDDRIVVKENKSYLILKRMVDILGSIVGLLISLPGILIIVVLIKFEDGGPIIFKQTRIGKNGKKFFIYKFRSMRVDAEEIKAKLLCKNEISGAMFKMKDDPRVTKIGKFIRKTSLDEIPQFINVLKGDMSLVGPRPPLAEEVEVYTDYELQRLLVTPGLSGLWQVSGRSNVSFMEMVSLDLKYIQTRTILLDFFIIFKTIANMFKTKKNGAF